MTQPANNLRVRRTRKLLREALIELTKENSFEAITVGEITERAMVSRASFYRNYKDKYDLVEQVFEEAIQALRDFVSLPGAEHPTIWVKFFEHVAEYEKLYRALLGRNGSPWFAHKMRSAFITMMREFEQLFNLNPQVYQPVFHSNAVRVDSNSTEINVPLQMPTHPGFLAGDPYVEDLVASILVETIIWWLEQGKPCTTGQIAERCSSLIGAVFRETSSWK
ncbi:MAG: TetR/AcrR family transcriptional regulator [Eubacteriales bacterium]